MALRKKKRVAKRAKKVTLAKGVKVKRGKESRLRKRRGGSNVGEYKKVAKGKFCGPSGGAPTGSYPVNTKKRCHAALAYAHNAPNPEGIKRCVYRKCAGEFKTKIKDGKRKRA